MYSTKSQKTDVFIIVAFLFLPWFLSYDISQLNLMTMGDNWRAAFPAYLLTLKKVLAGSSLLWNEHILAGHPFIAEIVNGVLYPPRLLLYLILPVKWAYNATILFHYSLTGWFTYLYLRSINLSRVAAFFGGSILMLSPIYRIQELDSISLLNTITWFPLIMYFLEKRVKSGHKKFLLGAALVFVLQIFAGFTQDSFYTAIAIAIYSAMRYYHQYPSIQKSLQFFLSDMVVFSLIVLSFAAIQLLPTLELLSFAQHYQQGWNLIESYSAPPLGLIGFFHPFIWGGFNHGYGLQTGYFLKTFTSTGYMGIVPIIFALYALRFWKTSNLMKCWVFLLLLTLIIASGVHIMPVAKLLYNFPLTHAFRFHTRMYFISSMAIVVMFAYAFDYILKQDKQSMHLEINKILKLGGIIILLTFVFLYGLISGVDFFQNIVGKIDDLKINNQPLQTLLQYYHLKNIGLLIPFITLSIGSLLLWLLPFTQKRMVLLCGLWLVCVLDIGTVSSGFRANQLFDYPQIDLMYKMKSLLKPTDRMIVSSENYSFTVSDNATMIYGMQSLDGFVSFDERTIGSLNNSTTSLANLQNPLVLLNLLKSHNDFLSMLGLKYFAIDAKYSNELTNLPYISLFTMDGFSVYENPNAKNRIYSVSNMRWEGDANYSEVNLLTTAMTNKPIATKPELGLAAINETIYEAGNVKANVSCPAARCFIVLSESYFPGWKVYVDGKKNTLYKVNDLIMGVLVGKGEHWLRFHYFPTSVLAGIYLFLFGLIWVPVWMMLGRKKHS
jgi:hypothetical protein